MQDKALIKALKGICDKDRRYPPAAYVFLLEALEFTAKMLNRPADPGPERHVSGQELLDGIRNYALQEFGPMTMTVLKGWGITRTEDFGEMVFNLVEAGKLRKTDRDSKADFAGGYDFTGAFVTPFLPESGPAEALIRNPRPTRPGGHGALPRS